MKPAIVVRLGGNWHDLEVGAVVWGGGYAYRVESIRCTNIHCGTHPGLLGYSGIGPISGEWMGVAVSEADDEIDGHEIDGFRLVLP